MSGWVKISEDWFEREHVEEIGAEAAMFHLSALAYSARHLTNGVIPRRALRRLYPTADTDATVARLIEWTLWEPAEAGFLIVAWADHILPADEVEHRREQSRITSERYRRHKLGDHSMCDRCRHIRSGGGDGVTDNVSDDPSEPTRSEPTRRGGEEWKAVTTGSAGASPARPPRASDGSLVIITEATLANLPLTTGEACPHMPRGWKVVGRDRLACRDCDLVARFDQPRGANEPTATGLEHLARRKPGVRPFYQDAPLPVWRTLHDADPTGVTLALDLASAIYNGLGARPDANDVNALAGDIYWRRISASRHDSAWEAYNTASKST